MISKNILALAATALLALSSGHASAASQSLGLLNGGETFNNLATVATGSKFGPLTFSDTISFTAGSSVASLDFNFSDFDRKWLFWWVDVNPALGVSGSPAVTLSGNTVSFAGLTAGGSYSFDLNGTIDRYLSNKVNVRYDVSVAAVSPVPEPETYALMLAGLGVVGWAARRRKSAAAVPAQALPA